MASISSGKTVYVVRLGAAAAPQRLYLRGHDDAVSWTADVAVAIGFETAEAARRFAARRLGGAWHVAEVERSAFRRVPLLDEVDVYPETGDAAVEAARERLLPEAVLIPREQGLAFAAHRKQLALAARLQASRRSAAEIVGS